MLIGVQDVAVVLEDEVSNAGDDSFAVGTADEENGGIFHERQILMPALTFCSATQSVRETRSRSRK